MYAMLCYIVQCYAMLCSTYQWSGGGDGGGGGRGAGDALSDVVVVPEASRAEDQVGGALGVAVDEAVVGSGVDVEAGVVGHAGAGEAQSWGRTENQMQWVELTFCV